MTRSGLTSADIRAQVGHPIIDFDGHTLEFLPALFDHLRDEAGPGSIERLFPRTVNGASGAMKRQGDWYSMTPSQRRDELVIRPAWWSHPSSNTLDRATTMLPKLLHERLDSLGMDVCICYPTIGLTFAHIDDNDLRVAACRALNAFHAEIFAPFADRLIPVGVLPLHTPREGVDSLQHARS